ncbi:hypothetical protein FACS189464_2050 [Bacteroidia bacterium]|nr:hypothetical protein FACS189464_2050 [Bacteroidia bacterium]
MYVDFTKSQQRIARTLIETGLQRECENFIKKIGTFTQSANYQFGDPHKVYLELYKKVNSFDKHIARRYNDMRNSILYMTVLTLFYEKVLLPEDIAAFDKEVQNALIKYVEDLDKE